MKSHKYLDMHQDLLGLCKKNNIGLIPGKAAYVECQTGQLLKVKKNFFLLPKDFEILSAVIDEVLPVELYQIKRSGQPQKGREITIGRRDIFAGSVPLVIKNPNGDFFPAFGLKELILEGDDYTVVMNKTKKTIPHALFDETMEVAYLGFYLVLPTNQAQFFECLYGETVSAEDKVTEYPMFYEEFDCKSYITEALQRGLLTDEFRKKDIAFAKWSREEKRPIIKAYMEYEEELLSTELSE